MILSELLRGVTYKELKGSADIEVSGLTYDSRSVSEGYCFFAVAGTVVDGHNFIGKAIEGGAKAGDTLLVTGGNSGLASVMIPMAKAFGIRVITTVRSEEKKEAILSWGADRIVNTSEESLAEVLRAEQENGRGVDLAIDCLGSRDVGECLPYLNRGARWIMIASLAGDLTEVNLKTVYVRGIRLIGSTLRSRAPKVKAEILAKLVKDVWPKVESGEVKPTIYKVLPITEAEVAHDILYKGENVGKVVLSVG